MKSIGREQVLFYVGGIGATPALSILSTWAAAAATGIKTPHATLLWAVREPELLTEFAGVIGALAGDPANFTLQLYRSPNHCASSAQSLLVDEIKHDSLGSYRKIFASEVFRVFLLFVSFFVL